MLHLFLTIIAGFVAILILIVCAPILFLIGAAVAFYFGHIAWAALLAVIGLALLSGYKGNKTP